jgi:hypothetical protein
MDIGGAINSNVAHQVIQDLHTAFGGTYQTRPITSEQAERITGQITRSSSLEERVR